MIVWDKKWHGLRRIVLTKITMFHKSRCRRCRRERSEWLNIQLSLHIIFMDYDVYHGLYYKNSKCKSYAHNIYRNYYSKIQLDDLQSAPGCSLTTTTTTTTLKGGGFSKVLINLHSPWYTHQLGRWKSIESLIAWTFMLLFHFVVSNWVLWDLIRSDGGYPWWMSLRRPNIAHGKLVYLS